MYMYREELKIFLDVILQYNQHRSKNVLRTFDNQSIYFEPSVLLN